MGRLLLVDTVDLGADGEEYYCIRQRSDGLWEVVVQADALAQSRRWTCQDDEEHVYASEGEAMHCALRMAREQRAYLRDVAGERP